MSATIEYRAYLASEAWQTKRREALERASHACQLCNRTKKLNVHHRTYERLGAELPGDLTVLCEGCHKHFHGVDKPAGRSVARKRAIPTASAADGAKAAPRVISYLGRTPHNAKGIATGQIANKAGIPRSKVKAALMVLETEGRVRKVSNNRWALAGQRGGASGR